MLLLAGCANKKTDSERFSEEFNVSEENTAKYLKNIDEVVYQLNHGIHVVLIASGDEKTNQLVKDLVETIRSYPGMVIYYYEFTKMTVKDFEAVKESVPYLNIQQTNPILMFVKEGETVECLNSWDVTVLKEQLDNINKDVKPGCDDC